MSRNRSVGTSAETAVVEYLRPHFPYVERRASNGAKDRGDISGLPGVVVEVKRCGRLDFAAWITEMRQEVANANARFGAVWAWRRGKGSPADWYVVMTGADFLEMLKEGE